MRNLIKTTMAFIALMALTAPAVAQACTPLPPKELQGIVNYSGFVRQSVAAAYFQNNGCSWNGNDGLNGSDAYVFDVAGIEGEASAIIKAGPGVQIAYEGLVLNDGCGKLGETLSIGSSHPDFPVPYVIRIPAGAKWLIVQGNSSVPVSSNVATQAQVSITYDGKACEEPKKKKKKKRR